MKYILIMFLFAPLPNSNPESFIPIKFGEYRTELDCQLQGLINKDRANRAKRVVDYTCVESSISIGVTFK